MVRPATLQILFENTSEEKQFSKILKRKSKAWMFDRVLNMPWVLNIPGSYICQGSQYAFCEI